MFKQDNTQPYKPAPLTFKVKRNALIVSALTVITLISVACTPQTIAPAEYNHLIQAIPVNATQSSPAKKAPPKKEKDYICAKASWYELTSRTASGEMANPESLSAAHRTLPFGTLVELVNPKTHRKVIVRINDRGPYAKQRTIDVTRRAARELGFLQQGQAILHMHVVNGNTASLRGNRCQ
ncbi:septal ring lytic transglycosylase RlpA family protein [Polycladidibacter stylochi]|uniref:septal ring lytic transglycosylase RlpA family protein n=1 Tax=Polycladidibacter stylochi TaxID=1807766 RepID=UPI0009E6C7A0|nr:septal ring lytic transglycosylase RlpA family protein [Pseudovibrio stylochi]